MWRYVWSEKVFALPNTACPLLTICHPTPFLAVLWQLPTRRQQRCGEAIPTATDRGAQSSSARQGVGERWSWERWWGWEWSEGWWCGCGWGCVGCGCGGGGSRGCVRAGHDACGIQPRVTRRQVNGEGVGWVMASDGGCAGVGVSDGGVCTLPPICIPIPISISPTQAPALFHLPRAPFHTAGAVGH